MHNEKGHLPSLIVCTYVNIKKNKIKLFPKAQALLTFGEYLINILDLRKKNVKNNILCILFVNKFFEFEVVANSPLSSSSSSQPVSVHS